jgi:hypothetical protein
MSYISGKNMELSKAVALLNQAICGFKEAVDVSDKLMMAKVIEMLRKVIPNLLTNAVDRKSFDQFIGVVEDDINAAFHYGLQTKIPVPTAFCLNTGTNVNCGGPPKRYSRCDLCGRTGRP